MKRIGVRLFLLISTAAGAQTTYSSLGASKTHGNMTIDYTIGEALIKTLKRNNAVFTQGFHQPLYEFKTDTSDFMVTFIAENTCKEIPTGSIELSAVAGTEPYTYTWKDGYTSDTPFLREDVAAGIYSVDVSDANGNTITLNIEILETEECIKVYTGVTPNGDGNNDYWHIENIDKFDNNEVQVYSRWGNLVWEGTNYDNVAIRWEGFDKSNQRLPDATYFYVIKGNADVVLRGWVELTGELE